MEELPTRELSDEELTGIVGGISPEAAAAKYSQPQASAPGTSPVAGEIPTRELSMEELEQVRPGMTPPTPPAPEV